MPNWKKLITSGSAASLSSFQVTGDLTGSDNLYFTDATANISYDTRLNFFCRYDATADLYIQANNLYLNDYHTVNWGNGGDFLIQHTGDETHLTNYTGDLYITNNANDKDIILRSDNGAGNTTKYLTIDGSDTTIHHHLNLEQTGSINVTEGVNVAGNITVGGKIGKAIDDEYFDFGTDAMIKVMIDNVEDFRFSDGGTFHANADIVAFSTTVASDEKLKTNIAETKYGLDHILRLEPKEFDWKEKLNGRHDIGFIAQEVQEVVPELVKEVEGLNGEESHLSVDYTKVVPILVNAIKELKEEINELKSK